MMFNRFRRLVKGPSEEEKEQSFRLRVASARAEEALIKTHVENALLFVEEYEGSGLPVDQRIKTYVDQLDLSPAMARVVTQKAILEYAERPVYAKESFALAE